MTLQQLELFIMDEQQGNNSHTVKVEKKDTELSPQLPTAIHASSGSPEQLSTTDRTIEPITPTNMIPARTTDELIAYQEGDIVSINMPAEEEEPGVFWYLEGYYSHLLKAQGCIKRVLPYKNLQYEVEFNIKGTENIILLHHRHLQWIR